MTPTAKLRLKLGALALATLLFFGLGFIPIEHKVTLVLPPGAPSAEVHESAKAVSIVVLALIVVAILAVAGWIARRIIRRHKLTYGDER